MATSDYVLDEVITALFRNVVFGSAVQQTFRKSLIKNASQKRKLYQKNNSFLSTGSFFRKKVLKKQKGKGFIIRGCSNL